MLTLPFVYENLNAFAWVWKPIRIPVGHICLTVSIFLCMSFFSNVKFVAILVFLLMVCYEGLQKKNCFLSLFFSI